MISTGTETVGNQREVRQAEPRYCRGVVLRVKPESAQSVRELVESLDHRFYSSFVPAGGAVDFPNLDGPDTSLRHLEGDHVIIQSGGKMWCGYEAFIDRVRILAPHLEDGLFYVGDEQDYIDEFRIRVGKLHYKRLHQGSWRPLDDFLEALEPGPGQVRRGPPVDWPENP